MIGERGGYGVRDLGTVDAATTQDRRDQQDNLRRCGVEYRQHGKIASFEKIKNPYCEPDKRMWCAVLLRALKDVCNQRQDCLEWLEEDNTDDAGAFAWICNMLELNAESVRAVFRDYLAGKSDYLRASLFVKGLGSYTL